MIDLIGMIRRNILEKEEIKRIFNIGEKVLVLAERIKKNMLLGSFTSNLYRILLILIE